MAYKIYTERNLADTCRDSDNIVTEELCYKHSEDDAKSFARDYIRNNFFHKDTHLRERTGGGFTATDFSSYGATIIIEPIVIS